MKNPFLSRYARKRFLAPLLLICVATLGGGLPPPVVGALIEGASAFLAAAQDEE